MKLRIVLFGSYLRGKSLIEMALFLRKSFPETFDICGIATDDPFNKRVSPNKRVWQYVTDVEKQTRLFDIINLSREHNIPCWTGSIRETEFLELYKAWCPDICYMGTFGQKIPSYIFERPLYGFYNFHPSVDTRSWPSYAGGNPFKEMLENFETQGIIAMHEVNDEWDDGDLIAFSQRYPVFPYDSITELHHRSSPEAAKMMAWHLGEVLGQTMINYKPQVIVKDRLSSAHYGKMSTIMQKGWRVVS